MRCFSFSPALDGEKGFQILPDILSGERPLLTKDFTIAESNVNFIPERIPGLIVVRSENHLPDFTTEDAIKIVSEFKARFPDWASVDWSNLYVEMNERSVMVASIELYVARVREVGFDARTIYALAFSDPNFTVKFHGLIKNPGLRLIEETGETP